MGLMEWPSVENMVRAEAEVGVAWEWTGWGLGDMGDAAAGE